MKVEDDKDTNKHSINSHMRNLVCGIGNTNKNIKLGYGSDNNNYERNSEMEYDEDLLKTYYMLGRIQGMLDVMVKNKEKKDVSGETSISRPSERQEGLNRIGIKSTDGSLCLRNLVQEGESSIAV